MALSLPGQSSSIDYFPAFEVAAIKRTDPKVGLIAICINPGGRIAVTNYTLKMLVEEVYGVQEFQVRGGPKWADDEKYSIDAIPPSASESGKVRTKSCKSILTQEQHLMLRSLLRERFKAATHEERQQGALYKLVRTTEHPKLLPPADRNAYSVVTYGFTGIPERPDFMRGENASMGQFAVRLAEMLKRPVLDQTRLEGRFDFSISYVKEPVDPSQGPSLFTAVRELGLKLESGKGPVTYLIIDHAERPSPN